MGNGRVVVKTGDVVEGRYRINRTLGQGGVGTVFLAEHTLIKRRVAIKILHKDLATDADVIERFMNEARTAGTLGHPNIVESTDMGFTAEQVPYIVFEYLEGALLTDEIYRVGGLPVRRVVKIAMQIAAALEAAHRTGIVHGALESDNIFLTDTEDAVDHVKVLDFGVASFATSGRLEFLAPEQLASRDAADKRSDIYALGVILYEMLTARRPFSCEDDQAQLRHRIATWPPPPLQHVDVPAGLGELILGRLLAKDPADRFQTMREVAAALEPFLNPEASVVAAVPARATPVPTTAPFPLVDETSGAVGQIAVAPVVPAAMKRPGALYAVAGAGVLVGMIGLVIGLRGKPAPVVAPAASIVQAPAPAAAVPVAREAQKIEVALAADVPNAHVVFRRHVAAAPATMQVAASEIVELVEISAPGYRTQRYWLTFDRPTHLQAHLVKGSGIVEATEEETLIALGEVAAPVAQPAIAQPAIAAKPVEARAPVEATVARPAVTAAAVTTPPATGVASAPRKIGKAAADATPADAAGTTGAAASTVEAASVEMAGAPLASTPADGTTVGVATSTAAPAAAAPSAPGAPTAAPPAAGTGAITATPARIEARATPAIDRATMASVVGAHRPEVLKCLADGKKKDHAMQGTLSLQLEVAPTGKVHRVQVQSTLDNPLVAACVVRAANTWTFPARSDADLATVTYPFTIH